jgi:FkbM family methyltransferase
VGPTLPRQVRKLPYYLSSLVALGRIATVRSLIRCAFLRSKQLDLRHGPSLRLCAVVDLLVVKETLVDDVYSLGTLDAADGVIVDVGAGIGEFTLAAAARFPHLSVYAYEPNPQTYRLLEENILRHGARNVRAARLAIGTEESYVLHGVGEGPRSSAAALAGEDSVVVAAERLDRSLPDMPVRLLKIDCEGLELDVLRSAAGLLDRVERVAVEYHRLLLPDADRLVGEFLREHGLRIQTRADPYDDDIGYVYGRRLDRDSVGLHFGERTASNDRLWSWPTSEGP